MPKKAKDEQRQGTCLSRIEYGAIVDKANVVTVFEAGDDVSGIDETVLAGLVTAGAIRRVDAAAEAEADADANGKQGAAQS